jgi:cell division protein FtsQ
VSHSEFTAPLSRSWRDIPQQVKPRAMSNEGRRRLIFNALKTAGAVALLAALGWGGVAVAQILREGPEKTSAQAEGAPVRDIVLVTDGALDRDWIVRTLALPKNATLMGLDLYRLRSRLLASGQVRTAALTRNFPATLAVTLAERLPVARLMAQMGGDTPRQLLVARDGVVFDGIGYDSPATSALPWLDGMKLIRQGDTFLPIAGMETVADLLAKARLEAEHLYRTWQVVSLARLQSDGEIEVRTQALPRIVFGTQEDFFPQLARLDLLLDTARAQSGTPLREVNLAIGRNPDGGFQVPVAVDGLSAAPPAAVRGERAARPVPSPRAPILLNLQLNTKL